MLTTPRVAISAWRSARRLAWVMTCAACLACGGSGADADDGHGARGGGKADDADDPAPSEDWSADDAWDSDDGPAGYPLGPGSDAAYAGASCPRFRPNDVVRFLEDNRQYARFEDYLVGMLERRSDLPLLVAYTLADPPTARLLVFTMLRGELRLEIFDSRTDRPEVLSLDLAMTPSIDVLCWNADGSRVRADSIGTWGFPQRSLIIDLDAPDGPTWWTVGSTGALWLSPSFASAAYLELAQPDSMYVHLWVNGSRVFGSEDSSATLNWVSARWLFEDIFTFCGQAPEPGAMEGPEMLYQVVVDGAGRARPAQGLGPCE